MDFVPCVHLFKLTVLLRRLSLLWISYIHGSLWQTRHEHFLDRAGEKRSFVTVLFRGEGSHIEWYFESSDCMYLRLFCLDCPIKDVLSGKIIGDDRDVDVTSPC